MAAEIDKTVMDGKPHGWIGNPITKRVAIIAFLKGDRYGSAAVSRPVGGHRQIQALTRVLSQVVTRVVAVSISPGQAKICPAKRSTR